MPVMILGLSVFLHTIAGSLGYDDNRLIDSILYGSRSVGVILFLRFVILYIGDLLVKDPKSGLAEVLAVPVAAVVYGTVIWLLPDDAGEGERKFFLKLAKLASILIISVLVYFIFR